MLAPGSESHTSVALKYEMVMRDRLQLSEVLLKKVGGCCSAVQAGDRRRLQLSELLLN